MKRILIVEDEAHLRLLYEIELNHVGFQTMTAASGSECLEYIETMPVDLVVLDIRMPGMDGIEVLQKIIARRRNLPVVIHTAYGSYRKNYLTWGAVAYLTKSADLEELITTVRRLLKSGTRESRLTKRPVRSPMPSTEREDHVVQSL